MITLKKDEKRVITVMMDDDQYSSSESDVSSDESRSKKRGSSPQGRTIGEPVVLDKSRTINDRIDVVLAGENSSVEVVGLVLGKGNDQKSLEAYITHAAPNTKSNVNVRSVLRDRSTFAFRGNVKIEKGAKGSDAYLRSDALLFDDAKMGDDTPALEILEPDVKAGHAATIGKVDEQMVFYLMSRGLSRKVAEEMIIEGFVEQIRHVILGSTSSYLSVNSATKQSE